MKTKLLILLLLLLAPANKLLMQEIPDCMCAPLSYPPTGQLTNQDSACVIDTCGIWYPSISCDSAFWNNIQSKYGEEAKKRVYSTGFWDIEFSVPAIPIPATNADTIIYVNWTAIDTTYPEIRNTFRDMDENYGDLYFRKLSPSAGEKSKRFLLYFNVYVNIETIKKIVRQINGVEGCDFGRWPYRSMEDYVIDNVNDFTFSIFPNPASEYIEISVGARHAVPVWNDQIQIFNVYGEQMYNFVGAHCNVPLRINISNLPVGFYFIRCGLTVKSFVVLR